MKTKLLLFYLVTSFLGYSQAPILNFDSAPMSMYAIVTPTNTIDQSVSGANLTWDFTLNASGVTSTDTYEVITMGSAIEISYPGTTSALTTTASNSGVSRVFTENSSNTLYITGIEGNINGQSLVLNYSGDDNALIGVFPLNYEDSNSGDIISGTFTFDGNSGAFTGTATSIFDAYGTLTMNDVGGGAFNGSVSRLKLEQVISLTISTILGPISLGTVTQTSYYYYASNGDLVFRSNEADANTIGGSQNTLVMESLVSSTLGATGNNFDRDLFSIFPNPVNNDLNFNLPKNVRIEAITIFDTGGREILNKNTNESSLQVNQLDGGLYLLSVKTDRGILSTKFIKK